MPEKKESLAQQTADRLLRMILEEGQFVPGGRIPDERSLSKDMGVSRTSLREAIKLLVANGVLEIRRGIGTFVSENPGQKTDPFGFAMATDKRRLLNEWYQVRLFLESEAMEEIAKKATDAELCHIVELAEQDRAAIKGIKGLNAAEQASKFMHMDYEFHCTLAAATHNNVMYRVLSALFDWDYFGVAEGLFPLVSAKMEANADYYHCMIAEFLSHRDGKGANLAMRMHMNTAMRDIEGRQKNQAIWT